ncbi:hypothetical protein [Peribacillus asahii]|nr:hypothetical protein [Peribacillus asahii]USK62321.1 hypothetical protein LIT37_24415 [Peribacillus asahii]
MIIIGVAISIGICIGNWFVQEKLYHLAPDTTDVEVKVSKSDIELGRLI